MRVLRARLNIGIMVKSVRLKQPIKHLRLVSFGCFEIKLNGKHLKIISH